VCIVFCVRCFDSWHRISSTMALKTQIPGIMRGEMISSNVDPCSDRQRFVERLSSELLATQQAAAEHHERATNLILKWIAFERSPASSSSLPCSGDATISEDECWRAHLSKRTHYSAGAQVCLGESELELLKNFGFSKQINGFSESALSPPSLSCTPTPVREAPILQISPPDSFAGAIQAYKLPCSRAVCDQRGSSSLDCVQEVDEIFAGRSSSGTLASTSGTLASWNPSGTLAGGAPNSYFAPFPNVAPPANTQVPTPFIKFGQSASSADSSARSNSRLPTATSGDTQTTSYTLGDNDETPKRRADTLDVCLYCGSHVRRKQDKAVQDKAVQDCGKCRMQEDAQRNAHDKVAQTRLAAEQPKMDALALVLPLDIVVESTSLKSGGKPVAATDSSSCSSPRQRSRTESKMTQVSSVQSSGDASPRRKGKRSLLAVASDENHCQSNIFEDPQVMRDKIYKALNKPRYNVFDFYQDDGVWQLIARNILFENITLCVIAFNALWIAVDADLNQASTLLQAKWQFQLAENLFCAYFSFEWFVRFMSFKRKRDGSRDPWFVFDTALVVMMVLETWLMTGVMILFATGGNGFGNASILRIARLLRLSRMARMGRLLRAVPDLVIMVKGMLASTRSVVTTLFLLVSMTYVFGVAFRQLTEGTEIGRDRFDTVVNSMKTLIIYGVLTHDLVEDYSTDFAEQVSPILAILYCLYILLAALTVMNMLIGVLCEVVSDVAAAEKDKIAVTYAKENLEGILKNVDTDGNMLISKKEFKLMLEVPEACVALNELGVDVAGMIEFADVIFETASGDNEGQEVELTFSEFMDIVLQLRGTTSATVKDIVELRKLLRTVQSETNALVQETLNAIVSQGGDNSRDVTKDGSRVPPLRMSVDSSYGCKPDVIFG